MHAFTRRLSGVVAATATLVFTAAAAVPPADASALEIGRAHV